jgi:hypothetical protein
MGLMDKLKSLVAGMESAPAETLVDQAPGTAELYASSIESLLQSEPHIYITIEGDGDACVQVAKVGDQLSLNITGYAYEEQPESKLAELGIALPAGSSLESWEADSYCQFSVPVAELSALASTIETLFRNLYKEHDGYTVSISMDA